ncbi:MAG: hypothetical protein H7249_04290 [Chitinophagaceae bacterium]|nr:hypothetical protein [Oligoflexus sp.]
MINQNQYIVLADTASNKALRRERVGGHDHERNVYSTLHEVKVMGQLEDEIEDASRGRKVSVSQPDHTELDKRMKETDESFDKVNADRQKPIRK